MHSEQLNWHLARFSELDNTALYQILHLRQLVFALEQDCVYLDADNADQGSHHLFAYAGDALAAYLRAIPPKNNKDYSQLGRIVTHPDARGGGLGHELVSRGIRYNMQTWANSDIKIGAQAYLQKFYSSHGFTPTGDTYDEHGIPHITMILKSADYVHKID